MHLINSCRKVIHGMKAVFAHPLFAFLAAWIGLALATSIAYKLGPCGVPDCGRAPTPIIPWFFWVYRSGDLSLWTSLDIFSVWLLSCLVLFIPSAAGLFFSRSVLQRLIICLSAVGEMAWAAHGIWSWRMAFFAEREYSLGIACGLLAPAWLWVGALVLGGAATGFAASIFLTPKPAGHYPLA